MHDRAFFLLQDDDQIDICANQPLRNDDDPEELNEREFMKKERRSRIELGLTILRRCFVFLTIGMAVCCCACLPVCLSVISWR
jgi:hypothetical protein